MAETGDTDVTPEWRFVTIGRGSFASVSVLTGHPIAFKHVILPERSQEPGGSLILYVASTTPMTRTPSSQFLDRLPSMIPAFPPVSLPHQDARIQRFLDDLFVLVSLKAISKCSNSTLPPTRWIMSHLFL